MSEKSSFFDSIGDDRLYNSADFANYFNSLITNGVFPNPSTNLQVLTNNDMTVTVKAGKAWINGYVYINDSDLILPIEVADGVLNRIDRIVVQFNTVGRAINAVVKKGTFASSPIAPALVRDADFYELGIADIYIVNGATNIVQGDITDLRMNTTYCGWVNSLIQADTTAIFDQYQAWFTTQSDTYDADMLATQTQFETDFNTWFATVQNALDGDTAGNLLNLINANSAEIGDLSLIAETDLVSAIQADRSSLADNTQEHGDLTLLNTTDKTSIVNSVNELFTDVDNGKSNVYSAIVGKGSTPISEDFTDLVTGINSIVSSSVKTVQRGSTDIASVTFKDVTISAIDVNSSIVNIIVPYGSSLGADKLMCSAEIINATTMRIHRNTADASTYEISWEVIEFNGVKSLQKGISTTGPTITSVNMAKSIVFDSVTTTSNSTGFVYIYYSARLLTSTNLYLVGASKTHYWQLIEFN